MTEKQKPNLGFTLTVWCIRIVVVIGFILNGVALSFAIADLFTQTLTWLEYLKLIAVICLRIVGFFFIPLGAVLGYF
jgi:hypothetical protein